jgi:hypothetical protein
MQKVVGSNPISRSQENPLETALLSGGRLERAEFSSGPRLGQQPRAARCLLFVRCDMAANRELGEVVVDAERELGAPDDLDLSRSGPDRTRRHLCGAGA